MQTKLIEATDATEFNHGKFLVGRFCTEWMRTSVIDRRNLLSSTCGWTPDHIVVLDLQTGEGATFRPGGIARCDLKKHRIWVCPMFEPFLAWLYTQDLTKLDALPDFINLGDVPTAMFGYRRDGTS